jgi:hypothetical protein
MDLQVPARRQHTWEFLASLMQSSVCDHIKCTMKPITEQLRWTRCKEVQTLILEKLPIFLHEFDEQCLKQGLVHPDLYPDRPEL